MAGSWIPRRRGSVAALAAAASTAFALGAAPIGVAHGADARAGAAASGADAPRAAAASADAPTALKVELQPFPLAVENLTAPALSWQVRAGHDDAVQRAYQVRVATDDAGLADGGSALWDSGRVASSDATGIPYGGPALSPGTRYRWSVRTWTTRRGAGAEDGGVAGAWSVPATFGTGLSSWSATPIWAAPGENGSGWGDYTLRATVRIDTIAGGISFRARDNDNALMWQVRGDNNRIVPHTKSAGTYATSGSPILMPAGITLGNGQPHTLEIVASGDTFRTSVDGQLLDTRTISGYARGTIGFRNGNSEVALWDDVSVTAPDATVLYSNDFSRGAADIGCGTVTGGMLQIGRGGQCLRGGGDDWAFMRGELTLPDKAIASATLYATGASRTPARQYVFRAFVNGRLVGLGPAPAPRAGDHSYSAWDVTALLRRGAANVIGAQAYTTADKRFLAQLEVLYADGTRESFGSGAAGWRALPGFAAYPSAGSIGTNFFAAPVENIDARELPEGWDEPGFDDSAWSAPVEKAAIAPLVGLATENPGEHELAPVRVTEVEGEDGHWIVDFGRTSIGGVKLHVPSGVAGEVVELRMGEELNADGTVRWEMRTGNKYRDRWTLRDGEQTLQHWGYRVFRYLELVGLPPSVTAEDIRATSLRYPFDADEATFSSSDPLLDEVWEFTKQSIEVLDFDIYMDSASRERGPEYAGDTYINMMAQHALSSDRALARLSTEYGAFRPSWPTEWRYASILGAWEDWQQTGDTASLARQYGALRAFLPTAYLTDEPLVRKPTSVGGVDDLVDWPAAERDGYVFSQTNTAINAWAYRAFSDMAQIAEVLGRTYDQRRFSLYAEGLRSAINERLWDPVRGAYRDGLAADGSPIEHWAVHATVFPLAFGVAGPEQAAAGARYLADRTMSCSVFCANFVLEGLTNAGRADASIAMMTSDQLRSWRNMIRLGAGSVAEAWDPSLKPNMTFSHPWSASPAVNVTKGILGLRPAAPGWSRFTVAPQPGTLSWARLKTPTVAGTIGADFDVSPEEGLVLTLDAPANTVASVVLPRDDGGRPLEPGEAEAIYVDGRAVPTRVDGSVLRADVGSGTHEITARRPALVPGGEDPGAREPGGDPGRGPGGETPPGGTPPGETPPGGTPPGRCEPPRGRSGAAGSGAAGSGAAGSGAAGSGAAGSGKCAPGGTGAARLTRLRLAPKALRPLASGGPTTRRGGARLSFRLSAAARVRVAVARVGAGRRVGGRCTAGATRGPRCELVRARGAVTVAGRPGANALRLSGRLGGKALAPGRYRLTVTPAGGKPATVALRILPRR